MSRNKIIGALAICALLALAYYFARNMESRWVPELDWSAMRGRKEMALAQRFLEENGYQVTVTENIHQALVGTLPKGTMFIVNNDGMMQAEQVKKVLQWIRAGNTLIFVPENSKVRNALHSPASRTANEADEADENQADENESATDGEAGETIEAGGEAGQDQPDEDGETATDSRRSNSNTAKPGQAAPMNAVQRRARTATSPGANLTPRLVRDPFGHEFAVYRDYRKKNSSCAGKTDRTEQCPALLVQLLRPHYRLRMAPAYMPLQGQGMPTKLLAADQEQLGLRMYREGAGRVVMLADNYFSSAELIHYDHAELLLSLMQLNEDGKNVNIVRHLEYLPWYLALWQNFYLTLLGFALLLFLLLWVGLRRFGPLLPEPSVMRRALIEHIDASSRWLWKLPAGPQLLLDAARKNTDAILRRRIAEWGRFSSQEQVAFLAAHSNLSATALWFALHEKAALQPHRFTEQVQLLQTLRKQYERK